MTTGIIFTSSFSLFIVPMTWKQRKWINGIEGAYSHIVNAVLKDAGTTTLFTTLNILS